MTHTQLAFGSLSPEGQEEHVDEGVRYEVVLCEGGGGGLASFSSSNFIESEAGRMDSEVDDVDDADDAESPPR